MAAADRAMAGVNIRTPRRKAPDAKLPSDVLFSTAGNRRSSTIHDPANALARVIADALDPTTAPSRGVSLAEMSPEKRAEMERLYGGRK